jgi:tetratricopeptide (TPR) repeat protein
VRSYSTLSDSTYEAPTAERNSVGKSSEASSHIPWWDKIGVNTAMDANIARNWVHPAMSDAEIEELVQQMPTDLELAGLGPKEREQYLRARYTSLQLNMARSKSIRQRSHSTFEPVLFEASWSPSPLDQVPINLPSDATPITLESHHMDVYDPVDDKAFMDYESIPHQPYGPRTPPPPLPDVSYWERRKQLEKLSVYDKYLLQRLDQDGERLAKAERDFERAAPWFSSSEAERERGEAKLRADPDSRQKIALSIESARALRTKRREFLKARDERFALSVKAQGGHERLEWHQITAEEWKSMSDVEFAYWRYRIASDWINQNEELLLKEGFQKDGREGEKSGHFEHPGTFMVALRRSLREWQDALYEYEKAKRPAHMTADDMAIWHYQLTREEWFKAGRALEDRLVQVERRAILHRRHTVLSYLSTAFSDWISLHLTALENTKVLDKWGLHQIELAIPPATSSGSGTPTEAEIFRYREKMKFEWTDAISTIMNGLQNQKEIGPFPFQVPLEKIDQHIIDSIYLHLVKGEEEAERKSELRLFEDAADLPPIPSELKMLITNHIAMLASSGDDAASGLFGPKLASKRAEETKRSKIRTLQEIDRRTRLMHQYWHDHGIKEVSVEGQTYQVPAAGETGETQQIPFSVVERLYFELMDQGLDVHGLYEKPQWEIDEAGRYRRSSLSPLEIQVQPPIALDALQAGGSTLAFGLLLDLTELAFPGSAFGDNAPINSSDPTQASKSILDLELTSSAFLDLVIPGMSTKAQQGASVDWALPTRPMHGLKRQRDLSVLRKVSASAPTQVLRMEREAAFYSVEQETVDPHPHLWQRLLNLVWKMRMPPRFLISRLPKEYQEWIGVTEVDFLGTTASTPADTSSEAQLALNPQKSALENPRRKAWELTKRTKAYKSMLLGATLSDPQRRAVARIQAVTQSMRDIVSQATTTDSHSPIQQDIIKETKGISDEKFRQRQRDLVEPDEISAANWISNFSLAEFCAEYGGLTFAILAKMGEIQNFGARFTESSLKTVESYTEPPTALKFFQIELDALLKSAAPKEALELGTELFHRRQRIQRAFSAGLPPRDTALLMNYYLAYALRSKIELVMKHAPQKSDLDSWVSRIVPSVSENEIGQTSIGKNGVNGSKKPRKVVDTSNSRFPYAPKTVASAVWQFVLWPYYVALHLLHQEPKYLSEHRHASDIETERRRAGLLSAMTKQLEVVNAVQPWRMWSQEPWTWQGELKKKEQVEREREVYEKAMTFPRRSFWKNQQKLWDEYLDTTLSTFHQLMIEQRLRQGIPTHIEEGGAPVDGTAAAQHFQAAEALLEQGRYREAVATYELASRYGNADAHFALGKLYSAQYYPTIAKHLPNGLTLVQPNLERTSRRHLLAAAHAGHLPATLRLVRQCTDPPEGAPTDATLAINLLRSVITTHDSDDARLALAAIYSRSSNINDQKVAQALYTEVGTREALGMARDIQVSISKRSFSNAGHLKDTL